MPSFALTWKCHFVLSKSWSMKVRFKLYAWDFIRLVVSQTTHSVCIASSTHLDLSWSSRDISSGSAVIRRKEPCYLSCNIDKNGHQTAKAASTSILGCYTGARGFYSPNRPEHVLYYVILWARARFQPDFFFNTYVTLYTFVTRSTLLNIYVRDNA